MREVLVTTGSEFEINPGSGIASVEVNTNTIDALVQAGLVPIIAPSNLPRKMYQALYKRTSGLYLTGGRDWNPALYQRPRHQMTEPSEDRRDTMELELLRLALHDRKPVLGVCRGEQGMAIAAAMDEVGMIPDDLILQHISESTNGRHHAKNYAEVRRKETVVAIKPDTLARKVIGQEQVVFHCAHHQAVNAQFAERSGVLVVSGVSTDDIAEIIEGKDMPFYLGIQPHSEFTPQIQQRIMAGFASAVELFAEQK